MSKINIIQQKIKELSGGEFQNLCDIYLYKKYNFPNICSLGTEDGTNKSTKGTPDSYVITSESKYILIMYGSVKNNSYKKLENDIKSCFYSKKLNLKREQIEKIICVYTSTNITPEQRETLNRLTDEIPLEIIDLGTLSYDLLEKFPSISNDILNVPIGSNQIFSVDEFITFYNKRSVSSPLDTKFLYREQEVNTMKEFICTNLATVVVGVPGVGKTKLVLETCKVLDTKGFQTYCVKSNGVSLEADLNIHFETPGNYILFLDDINEIRDIEYILSFIHTRKNDINIKLVATVRDYAKAKIIDTLFKYTKPQALKIEKFSNNEIKQILQQNYNINNPRYIEQICKIAQGNIRLAIMAAQRSISDGFIAITDVNQLFKSYYLNVLNDFNADTNIYCILFIIGFLGATNYKLNEITHILLKYFNIDENIFMDICDNLYLLEIIDKYENEILKINDQNFKDFILYYVLIEQKYISIEDLLNLTFPKYSTQIINVINMILRIFYSKENLNYIEEEVNKAWDNCNQEDEYYYVKHFFRLNLDRTLLFIQNRINSVEIMPYNIEKYNIRDRENNKVISAFEVEILSNFKRTQYCSDAIELLTKLFDKNAEYIHDVYIALSDSFSYDEDSYSDDYKIEYLLVDKLWELSAQGSKIKETLLLLSLSKSLMEIEKQITRNGLDNRSLIIQSINIIPTDGSLKLRRFIWEILYKLYKVHVYKPYVEECIFNYHVFGPDNKHRNKFIKFDMECFSKYFISKLKSIPFNLAAILYNLARNYDYLTISPPSDLLRYKENKEFMSLINILPTRHKRNSDWRTDDSKRKTSLFRQIKKYKKEDLNKFFKAYKKYETLTFCSPESIYSGLMDVFEQFKNSSELYSYIINLYFKEQIKTIYHPNYIVCNLFNLIGVKKTTAIIKKCRKDEKDLWLKAFYEEFPEAYINKLISSQLVEFTSSTLEKEQPRIISVYSLEKYLKYNKDIIKIISQIICKRTNPNKIIISTFIKDYLFEEDAKKLVELFGENIEILEELYFMYFELHGEHTGCLFVEILNRDLNFWNKFTCEIAKDIHKNVCYNRVFEHIWKHEKYSELIDIAIDNMILKKEYPIVEFISEKIFPKQNKSDTLIFERQQKYISNFIKNSAFDVKKLDIIFYIIVYRFDELKNKYIQELFKYNDSIEVFEKIPIEKSSYSWSGSLIPLIEQRIRSLENIKANLKGSKFIQHRSYLDNLINRKKEEIKRERREEYLENIYN
ncbi:hypothetical protein [Thomasclavelia cocleata]|uniref:hypothetical protein n=1 Tax=Thomasclavelia cocleata TaxID=69824 RepID=UPI002601FAA0|nr:hypothetical protein [Thomasclavelia cocleata]